MTIAVYELADTVRRALRRARPARGDGRGHHRPRPRDDRLLPRRDRRTGRARPRHAARARRHRRRRRRRPDRGRGDARAARARPGRARRRRAPARPARARQPGADVRMAFDLMPRDTDDDWQVVAERMALVPQGLVEPRGRAHRGRGRRASSRRGARPSRARKQADTWGGVDAATRPFFLTLVDEYDASGHGDRAFRDRLEQLATRATEAYASLGRFLVEEYAPHADRARPGRARALRAVRAGLQRHRARPRRDVRVGLGRAAPHRARDGPGRRAHRPRRRRRRGDRAPRDRPDPRDRGGRRVPTLEPGAARHHRRRAQRRALRHPRAGAAGRGDDRAARRRGGDVLHRPVRGLQPPRPHVVPDARQDALPALGRGLDLLPRGRPRPSPADRAGALPRRLAEPVPAHARGHVGPRRRAGRSTPSGSWASSATSTTPPTSSACCGRRRCARCASSSTSACTSSSRSPPTSATTPARRGRPSSRCRS